MSDSEKEDSMQVLEVTPMAPTISHMSMSAEIEEILLQTVSLDSTKTVNEPTCELCMSPYRKEMEEIHEKNKDTKEVQEFLLSRGVDVSKDVIKNHIEQHLTRGIRELQKVEYVNRLKRMVNQQLSTLDRISLCMSVLTDRLMSVNSLVPSVEETEAQIEKIKSSETGRLMGSFQTLLKLRASIMGEMKVSGELITLPTADFVYVFNQALVNAKTDGERAVINDLLTSLETLSQSTQ